jgi:hypothetical protein
LSAGRHRYLKVAEKNYSNLFETENGKSTGKVKSFIPLSVDLKDINFPSKYKVMFYTDVYLDINPYNDTRIADFTNWIDIPPPKFFISTFPDQLVLRPGDSKNITGILKSASGSIPNTTRFRSNEKSSIIKVHPYGISYTSQSSGVHPAIFHIQVPDKIQVGEYTVAIAATISTGSTLAPPEFYGIKHFLAAANSKGYLNNTANMTIKVLEPLSTDERFKQFWDIYGQPISIVLGGFAGGATTLLFDRLKKREGSHHIDNH